MKQNLLLVAVLATLSMANAAPLHKRATTFAACSSGSPTALTTSIQPDPPVAGQTLSVTIAGTTTSDLATGSQLVFQILDGTGTAQGDSAKLDFCTSPGVTCPVATGTAFSTTTTITMPATLPDGTYSLVAEVTDATGAVVGCSTGTIGDGGAPPPPDGGDAPPPPDGGDAPPPPDGGDAPPAPDGGDAPPDGGDAPPDGGDAPPDGGDAPPDGGDAPPDGGDGQ